MEGVLHEGRELKVREKILYLCTHGADDAERASLPFAMAIGAQVSEMAVTIVLQSEGVVIAVAGEAEHISARGFAPLKEQMDEYMANGGVLLACSACLTARQVSRSSLLEGVEVVSAARLNAEFFRAAHVICY